MAKNGFLHQLATRSLGLAPDIRLRAALPYAAPAEEPMTGEDNPVVLPAPLSAPSPPNREAPAGDLRPSARPPAGEPPDSPLSPNDLRFPARTVPDALAAQPPAVPAPAERQPPRHTAAPPTGDEARATLPAATVYRQAPGEATAAPLATALDRPAGTQSASPATDPAGFDLEALVARLVRPQAAVAPETATDSPTRPVPYIQPLVQPSRAGLLQGPSAVASASPADTEPAPEVRITIGRLEVNPPARPTPPPAPRPRGPAPLSLADYLARRNGGRP